MKKSYKKIVIVIVFLLLLGLRFNFKWSKGVNETKEVSIKYENNVNLKDIVEFFDYLN